MIKTTILLLLAALGACGDCFSADENSYLFRRSQGVYTSTAHLRDGVFLVCGDGGKIVKTTNYGQSWSWKSTEWEDDFQGVAHNGAGIALICGTRGVLLRSTDEGETWTKMKVDTVQLWSVCFSDSLTAAAVGDSGVVHISRDAGASWERAESGTTISLRCVSSNGRNGFIAGGRHGIILRSADGSSWSIASLDVWKDSFWLDMHTAANGSSIACGYMGDSTHNIRYAMLRSTDGGQTWSRVAEDIDYSETGSILCLTSLGNGAWLAGAIRETMIRSDDDGLSWRLAGTTGINAFWDTPRHQKSDRMLDIVAISDSSALFVGDAGIIGRRFLGDSVGSILRYAYHLTPRVNAVSNHDVVRVNDSVLLSINSSVHIQRSDDNGATWMHVYPARQEVGGIGSFNITRFFLHVRDSQNILAYGRTASSLDALQFSARSSDGGKTWKRTDELFGWDWSQWGERMMVPADSFVYRSSNSGVSWERRRIDPTVRGHCSRVRYVGPDNVHAFYTQFNVPTEDSIKYPSKKRDFTRFLRSRNHGDTWFQESELEGQMAGEYFFTPERGFVFYRRHLLLSTLDGGKTWTERRITENPRYSLSQLHFTRPNIGFMTTVRDTILVTLDGGMTWTEQPLPSYLADNREQYITSLQFIRQLNDSILYFMGYSRFFRATLPAGLRGTLSSASEEEVNGYNPQLFLGVTPHPAISSLSTLTVYGLGTVRGKDIRLRIYDFFGALVSDLSSSANGSNDGNTARATIPTGLAPGVYVAEVKVGGGITSLPFVVSR